MDKVTLVVLAQMLLLLGLIEKEGRGFMVTETLLLAVQEFIAVIVAA